MSPLTPEKASNAPGTPETAVKVVAQPVLVNMQNFLMELNDKVSEKSTEDATSDWSQASGGTGSAVQTTGQTGASVRDQAIANLPIPVVMQKQLEQHIRNEVKQLRKQALKIANTSKPGGAHKLNELYARIHRLNALLASLFEASVEVLKRLYVRVFVDKQNIQ